MDEQLCMACEGKPAPENNPCAVCGARATRPADDGLVERLTRPIIGIENRTPQEAFDIMCDRILTALRAQSDAEVEREAVVRFLKAQDRRYDNHALCLAVRIEAGEHRKDGV